MKIKTLLAGIIINSSALTGLAQQTRQVGDFTGIKVGDNFVVSISQSDENTVKVEARDSLQSKIKTEVKDGILIISADGKINNERKNVSVGEGNGVKIGKTTTDKVFINVGVKSLSMLEVTGSADIKTSNQLTCDKLVIKSNGAGDVHLELKANEIKTEISGAGDVSLKGTAQLLIADVSGAGDLKATNLEADKAKIKVSGAGDAKVNVKQSIDAEVTGAGSIIYKGNPSERNVVISGAGSVRESKSGNGEETASDTTKFKLGKKKYMIIGDNDNEFAFGNKRDSLQDYRQGYKHWRGIDLGVNGWLDYNNTLNVAPGATFMQLNYAKSYQFGLNLMEHDFHIYKNYVNIVTGFGFDFNHYAFSNNTSLSKDSSNYVHGIKDTMSFKKNTLNVSYIKVPLMLEINTSKNAHNNFHIAGGVEFAYKIHSVTKQTFEVDDHRFKIKQRDDFNLEPFRYSAILRIGYNNITVFADYGLNRLFQKNEGPQEYPFAIGVTIAI